MTFVTGLVLAAGASTRLGQPKQLLAVGDGTLLDASIATARACGFDQLVVALGGAAEQVEAAVDLAGVDVVHNTAYTQGCSSSVAAALGVVSSEADGIVLLLGDQPLVEPATVAGLISTAAGARIAVTRYRDGLGHPFWLGREIFDELAHLHGDKAVWKLVDAAGEELVTHDVDLDVPRDVDTWQDYEALLAARPLGPGRA
jgi:molybdenum cofactor cytidylyltransferase